MPFYSMKNWKNRDVEFPGRRTLTDVLTSTSQTVDVTRSEGTITEAGDAFDASTMNDLEGRIGSAFTLVDGAKFDKPVNSPSEGQVVKYSSGSVVWANESGGGGGGDIIPFLPLCTVNGAIANFPDGANNIPVEACIADITPTQTGTGDPSPSNPRPITGFTECNILKTGKNRFNINNLTATGITISDNEASGTNGSFYDAFKSANGGIPNLPKFKPNTSYTLSLQIKYNSSSFTTDGMGIRVDYTDGTYDQLIPHVNLTNTTYITVSGTSNPAKTIKGIAINYLYGVNITAYLKDIQLEEGSLSTAFESYKSESFEIAFGDTIYGGTLNATTGVLTASYKKVDMGDLTWTRYTSYNYPFYSANLSSEGIKTASSGDILIKCEIYKPIGALTLGGASGFGNNAHNLEVCQQSSGTQVMIQDSDYSTAPDFTDAVRGKKLIFELATPITIPLTSTAINTYYGVNNFSADTGDISVSYRADIQLYIDKKIAEI